MARNPIPVVPPLSQPAAVGSAEAGDNASGLCPPIRPQTVIDSGSQPDSAGLDETGPYLRFRWSGGCLRWWQVLDSNQRRRQPTVLQTAPFGRSGNLPGPYAA